MNKQQTRMLFVILPLIYTATIQAGTLPKFTITRITPTPVEVPSNGYQLVEFSVKNNLPTTQSLIISKKSLPSFLTQNTALSNDACSNHISSSTTSANNVFSLNTKESCILNIMVDGAKLKAALTNPQQIYTPPMSFPEICTYGTGTFQCSGPQNTTNFEITSPLPAATFLFAGSSGANYPLIIQSSTSGESWSMISNSEISDLPQGTFTGATCINASETETTCVAVGANRDQTGPLLAQSINNGENWTLKSISGIPDNTLFNAVSCSNPSKCYAVGSTITNDVLFPALVQNTNTSQAGSWETVTLPSVHAYSSLAEVSCSSNLCVAGGELGDNPQGYVYQINQASDEPVWSLQQLPLGGSTVSGIGCTQNFCALGVTRTGSPEGYIQQTVDAGSHWTTAPNFIGVDDFSLFRGSCASGVLCALSAAGFIYQTSNEATWFSYGEFPAQHNIDISCAGDTSAFCVGVFQKYDYYTSENNELVILYSALGGPWVQMPSTGVALTPLGAPPYNLPLVTCVGDYPNTQCAISTESGSNPPVTTVRLLTIDSSGHPALQPPSINPGINNATLHAAASALFGTQS